MNTNELATRNVWPGRLTSLFGDDLLPQLLNLNQSGLSLSEDDDHVYVQAAVPGLEPGEVSLSLHQGTLTVSGEHKEEGGNGRKHYRLLQNSFSYQVTLPSQVRDDSEPKAALKNGILTVTFDKLPEAKPRQIKIEG